VFRNIRFRYISRHSWLYRDVSCVEIKLYTVQPKADLGRSSGSRLKAEDIHAQSGNSVGEFSLRQK